MIPGLGSGVLGYISLGLHRQLWEPLWVSAEASFGSAHIYALNLEYMIDGGAR